MKMEIERKDAQISPVGPADEFPGRFEVVLSAPTLDRDGDTLQPEDWKQPLPDHITFDQDHAMTVAGTVGSGTPAIDSQGRLVVSGTYSSLPRAQEVRTLVNEGHIRTTSVAFLSEKSTKNGTMRVQRELLNGAFVAIPSNREAIVLSSKSGARNSKSDAAHIQSIHDAAMHLGAACAPSETAAKAATIDPVGLPTEVDKATTLTSAEGEPVGAVAVPQDPAIESAAAPTAAVDPAAAAKAAAAGEAAAGSAAADEATEMQARAARLRAHTNYANTPERG